MGVQGLEPRELQALKDPGTCMIYTYIYIYTHIYIYIYICKYIL